MNTSALPLAANETAPMTIFGPFYPSTLQRSINHAERLVEVLIVHQECAKDGEVWLIGRSDEIQCFVLDVAADWQRGRLSEQDAVRAIDDYLDDLHLSLALFYGQDLATCCRAVGARTTVPGRPEAATRVFPLQTPRHASKDTETGDATRG